MKWSLGLFALTLSNVALAGADDAANPDEDSWDQDITEEIDWSPEEEAIINGEFATEDDYPMTGALMTEAFADMGSWGEFDYRGFTCSSTLIAPDVVLTASHCVDVKAIEFMLTLGLGSVDIIENRWSRQADLSAHDGSEMAEWPEDSVIASDPAIHPEFDLETMEIGLAVNNDIALIFLDEPILDIPHAYLPTADEATQLIEGLQVTIVGWGQQSATEIWESPPEGSYGVKQMADSFINELGEAEFQVGAIETDGRKCHGDSGGPTFAEIVTDSPEKMRLIGVTSHAYDESDCNEVGGVDTRVDYFLEWIDSEMRTRCDQETRAWCDVPGIVPPPEPPALEEDPTLDEKRACGCAIDPVSGGSWLAMAGLMGLLALRRRDV